MVRDPIMDAAELEKERFVILEELAAGAQEFIDEYEEEIELWITYGGD